MLGRLKGAVQQDSAQENVLSIPLTLREEPKANVARYEQLRTNREASHVA